MNGISRRIIGIIFVVLLSAMQAMAQMHPALQHTTVKLGSSDSIDLDTLNLQLSFPVINKAGRGVSVHFAISYTGNFWKPGVAPNPGGWQPDYNYGWNFQPASILGSVTETEYDPQICSLANDDHDNYYVHTYGGRLYTDPLGLTHQFGGERQYSECSDSDIESYPAWTTADGYSINSGNYVYDASGVRVAVAENSDSNGNTYFANGQDTSGTVPLTVTGLSGTGVTGTTVTYTYKDANGTSQNVVVTFGYFNIQTAFGSNDYTKSNAKLPVTITYPDGTYTISYEPTPGYAGYTTARVASIQLPTGGTVSYSYGSSAPSTFDGSIPSLTRTTTDGTTTFTRTTSNQASQYDIPQSAQLVVQPPSGNATTYGFSAYSSGWDFSSTLYIPVSISNGVTQSSICYRFTRVDWVTPSDGNCHSYPVGFPILGRETTTTFDNGFQQVAKETFNTNGVLTDSTTSDIASSSPAVLAETQITYATFNNIQNHPSNRTVKDGSGATVSYVDYSYDGNSLTTTSGLPNRENIFGDRGNLTHVTYNGSISESFWYDDAGQLLKKQDPSGNYTNYQHDSTDTFVTETDLPATASGQSLALKSTYDAGSGLLLSQTDANSHTTTFGYDASLRQTSRTRQTASGGDGGVVSRTYVSNTQISITSANGSGGTADIEQIADSYGRPIRSARKIVSTVGKPWILTDTCYDANGRVSFKSLPYTAASLTGGQVCSGSGDTISYDGIGRTLSITHSDGSAINYAYVGRATKVTEESHGSSRTAKITQVDGLGRITAVCELTGTTLMPAGAGGPTYAPQLCGLDIDNASATGFLTTYSYNLAAHTTTSIQGSGTATQTRTWQTDAFGRPTSESIPEAYSTAGTAGTTSYTYAYNSTGLQVTRTAPQANQLSGSATTVTTTQFDALGRPQSIAYQTQGSSDPDTPDMTFTYDTSAAGNAQNVKGRLASVSSTRGSVYYSYTSNGQVRYKASTLPNNLCAFTYQTYSYDLLGNLLQSSDDIGGSTTVNTYDAAANPSQVAAGLGSATPGTILQNFAYDAFGITSLQFGNGWTGNMGYDSRGRMSSFAANSSGGTQYGYTVTWNPNGSLASASDTANGNWSYSYDDFNRLVSATQNSTTTTTYQYDVFGNRYPLNGGSGGSAIFSYDARNHNSLFSYDEKGNTVSTPQVDSDFDAEGRVVRVRAHNGTTVIAAYVYGPEGDRILATRGSKVTEYFYGIDGDLRMTRINGAVARVQVNTSVGQVGSFVSGSFQYEFHDWNGSSRMNVSTTGTILKTFQSDAFGANSNAATDDVAQVNALDVDADAYAAHAGARDYYPSYGVWNAPDPFDGSYDFGDPQSLNRYAYVGNSPVSYSDPTGLARVDNAPLDSVFSSFGAMYDGGGIEKGTTPPAGECKGWLCWIRLIPGLVKDGLGWMPSHIQFGGGGGSSAGSQLMALAYGNAGQIAVHPAQQQSSQPSTATSKASPQTGSVGGSWEPYPWTKNHCKDCYIVSDVMPWGMTGGLGAASSILSGPESKAIGGVLQQIEQGTTKGQVFENRASEIYGGLKPLPEKVYGYYRRYVVNLGGGKGLARIVVGRGREIYATFDHYTTWIKLR